MGTVVGAFQKTNLEGQQFIFFLSEGEGDGNNSMFTLEMNGTLRSAEVFDFEKYQSLSIRVTVMNNLNMEQSGIFSVQVIDLYETPPNQSPTQLSSLGELDFSEDQSLGSLVGQFFATDPDDDPIQYFLVDGDGDDNNSKFILKQMDHFS